MGSSVLMTVLLQALLFRLISGQNSTSVSRVFGLTPSGCNTAAAQVCEYNKLTCILFNGPANDRKANCDCAKIYHGQCLRNAGCTFANEVGALTKHEIYFKTCVDLILKYDCGDVTICSVNCASQEQIDPATTKIIPFNNYGRYYLRIRMCNRKINQPRYAQYAMVQAGYCNALSDYMPCSRFIPPFTYIPVAIPIDTTYIEVDSCTKDALGNYKCMTSVTDLVPPVRIYGNQVIWPRTFDVPQTNASVCNHHSDCLGSVCQFFFRPSICQPKTQKHIISTGKHYNDYAFSKVTNGSTNWETAVVSPT